MIYKLITQEMSLDKNIWLWILMVRSFIS
jgi:hypothetical protein